MKSKLNPLNISNVHMGTFILYLEIRKSTIVIWHYYNSDILCSQQKFFSWVHSRTSFHVYRYFFPCLMPLGFTVGNRISSSFKMIYNHCFACNYSIFYLCQHLLSFFCEFNGPFSNFGIDSTIFLFAIRIFLRIKHLLNGDKFINMAIIINSYTFLVCKASPVFPFI